MKIQEYSEISAPDGYSFIVDHPSAGTKRITFDKLKSALGLSSNTSSTTAVPVAPLNTQSKNFTYRGKQIGTTITNAQFTSIRNGTFTDMYIGDYWVGLGISRYKDVTFRIAAFDYYMGAASHGHHLILVSDTALETGIISTTNYNVSGYVNCYARQNGGAIALIHNQIINRYPNIYSHPPVSYLPDGYDMNREVAREMSTELMSLEQVAGIRGPMMYNWSENVYQFPLFRMNPNLIVTSTEYWLSSPFDTTSYTVVRTTGGIAEASGTTNDSFRPMIVVS